MKTKNNSSTLPKISEEALLAISRGVEQKHSISNLEKLGIKQRLINLLESHGITELGQLMNYKLFDCLSNYHKL
jgi:hypothetical protein